MQSLMLTSDQHEVMSQSYSLIHLLKRDICPNNLSIRSQDLLYLHVLTSRPGLHSSGLALIR